MKTSWKLVTWHSPLECYQRMFTYLKNCSNIFCAVIYLLIIPTYSQSIQKCYVCIYSNDIHSNFFFNLRILSVFIVTLVGWLVVLNVPSTARSFRDAPPFTVPCEGREAR